MSDVHLFHTHHDVFQENDVRNLHDAYDAHDVHHSRRQGNVHPMSPSMGVERTALEPDESHMSIYDGLKNVPNIPYRNFYENMNITAISLSV